MSEEQEHTELISKTDTILEKMDGLESLIKHDLEQLEDRVADLEVLVARLCEDSHGFNESSGGNDMRLGVSNEADRVEKRAYDIQKKRQQDFYGSL